MADWIAANRPVGSYIHQGNAKSTVWWCRRCDVNFNVMRATACGRIWLLRHEDRKHGFQGDEKDAKPCPAITIGEGHYIVDKAPDSLQLWVQGGMLTFKKDAEAASCTFAWNNDKLVLRAASCSPVPDECPCKSCVQAANDKTFLEQACRMAFGQRLGEYAQALALGTEEQQQKLWDSLIAADWKVWHSILHDIAELREIPGPLSRLNCIKRKLMSVSQERRSERYSAWVEATVAHLTMGSETQDERKVYSKLCDVFAGSLDKANLKLASQIAAGSLDGSKVVTVLLKSFYDMRERMSRGCEQRICSSKHLSEDTVQEILWSLGQGAGTQNVLRLFGLNIKGRAKVDLQLPWLPQPYCAHRCSEVLKTNCSRALQLLQVPETRNFFLAIDESAWHPTFSCIAGLLNPHECVIVGGAFSHDVEEDTSLLRSTEHLPQERMSSLSLHCLLCRMDSVDKVFDVSTIPMPKANGRKSADVLRYVGELLDALVSQNRNLPPAGLAFDAGTSNTGLKRVLLGLEKVEDCPFFDQLTFQQIEMPNGHFPFAFAVRKKKHVLLPSLDCLRILKRFSLAHISRSTKWGIFFVDFTCALRGGLSWRSFCVREPMSDRAAFVPRLHPGPGLERRRPARGYTHQCSDLSRGRRQRGQ